MSLRPYILAGLVAIAGGCVWQITAAEPKAKTRGKATPTPTSPTAPVKGLSPVQHEVSTAGFQTMKHFQGNMDIDQAVEIALRQNPEILLAIQDIQRTRGLVIEVRAAALPQITLTGSYDQTDKHLLEGGGGARTTTPTALPSGSLAGRQLAPENSQPVTNTNTAGTVASTNTTSTTGSTTTTQTAVRAVRKPAATAAPDGTAAATSPTVADLEKTLQQITSELQSNNGRSIQDKSWAVTLQVRQVLYAGGEVTAAIRIARFTQDSAYYHPTSRRSELRNRHWHPGAACNRPVPRGSAHHRFGGGAPAGAGTAHRPAEPLRGGHRAALQRAPRRGGSGERAAEPHPREERLHPLSNPTR
jgi:outer membrane protein TolC